VGGGFCVGGIFGGWVLGGWGVGRKKKKSQYQSQSKNRFKKKSLFDSQVIRRRDLNHGGE